MGPRAKLSEASQRVGTFRGLCEAILGSGFEADPGSCHVPRRGECSSRDCVRAMSR